MDLEYDNSSVSYKDLLYNITKQNMFQNIVY